MKEVPFFFLIPSLFFILVCENCSQININIGNKQLGPYQIGNQICNPRGVLLFLIDFRSDNR